MELSISREHIKRGVTVFSAQAGVQVLTALVGFLLVRALPKTEYALVTIALAFQAAMSQLSDVGIGAALIARGGQIWSDKERLGSLLNTALRLRKRLAIGVGAAAIPLLFLALRKNGAALDSALVLCGLVAAAFYATLSTVMLEVVMRLHSQVARLQLSTSGGALLRLAIVVACFQFLDARFALLASTLAILLQLRMLGSWVSGLVDMNAAPRAEYRRDMVSAIKDVGPAGVFYTFQQQITVWVISVFGTAAGVAEVGALSRLAALCAVFGEVIRQLVMPAFARARSTAALRGRYLQLMAAAVGLAVALVAFSFVFPTELLWLLGGRYNSLSAEVPLAVTSTMLVFVSGVAAGVNVSRGWLRGLWLQIPGVLLTQVLLALTLDFGKTRDVIVFGALSTLPTLALNILITLRALWRAQPQPE